MEITDIRVRKINSEGRMKAVVSVTFDGSFVVHDIKVIEGQEKLFVAMPSRKTPEGEFKDIAHPINAETREFLQNAIISKYEEIKDLEEVKQEDVKAEAKAEEIKKRPMLPSLLRQRNNLFAISNYQRCF